MARKNEIVRILMQRDGMSREDATELVKEARETVLGGEDPDEILRDWFDLEPDYIDDLLF